MNTLNVIFLLKKAVLLLLIPIAFLLGQSNAQQVSISKSPHFATATVIEESEDTLWIVIVSEDIDLDEDSFVVIGSEWHPTSFWDGLFNPPSTKAKKIMLNGR